MLLGRASSLRGVAFATALLFCARAETAPNKKACLAAADEGQDLRAAGKLRDARERFLACAVDACPPVVRGDCVRWVSELDGEIPSIVLRVSRGGVDVASAKIRVDGALVAEDGKPVRLDPGKHQVQVEADGQTHDETLVVVTGEKNRVVTIALPPAQATTPTPTPAPSEPAAHAPAWAWVSASVAVVGAGGFAYFAISGTRDVHRMDDSCAPFCSDADVDAARRKLIIGDVFLGVAVVAAGVATYGFLTVPKTNATATVSVLPGGAFAGLRGTF